MKIAKSVLAVSLALLAAPAVRANDSQAAIGLTGLMFEQNDAIAMESEDLYLSAEQVRVTYSYRNTSDKPVTMLVAFPLPDVPLPGTDIAWVESAFPDWDLIGMTTRVDGKEAQLMRLDAPKVGGKDVSARLSALGWPVLYWQDESFAALLAGLSADDKSELVSEGLLTTDGMSDGAVRPAWTVSTAFVRTQTFPPGKVVKVEHAYAPMTGGTVSSALDRSTRADSMDGPEGYRARYCVDDAFVAGYDRRRYRPDGETDDLLFPVETWLSYALAPGANWKGPIKRFRLTVDKANPQSLVSLCMDGIRKVSPTRFEVVKTDYEPDRDIDVLFVEMIPAEGGQ